MPRPSKPLIQRDSVVEASLRIIDTEGLAAFSLPRLARELNVRAPSLYHHFEDKAAILRAVARAVMLEVRYPDPNSVPNWIEWQVALSLAARDSILRHGNAAPILLEFMPRDVMIAAYNRSAALMFSLGVPVDKVLTVIDGLDKLTISAALSEAMRGIDDHGQLFGNADPALQPDLAKAVAANRRSTAGVFAESIRSFLRGAAPDVPDTAPAPTHEILLPNNQWPVASPAAS
ncbi:TetR/AcrR family transcriptional regulator [Mycobacterium sp.]|uniref:TetR/AcrR family transcriptional regulator n=1 Tax=Mycobacterium sp. TaxID=1785 RepID=UPI003BB17637